MELIENAEEILETLWIRTQEQKEESVLLGHLGADPDAAVQQLREKGFITVDNDRIRLTDQGLPRAADIIRRHRLAERLLIDVLFTSDAQMDDRACKFEHVLDRGVAESICCLLGHPRVCPHGKPIPPGECCREHRRRPHKLVSTLSQMEQGARGKISYVHAPQSPMLQKLMSMGILPGAPISLIQRFPSYVFQIRQEQFAVDKEIADSIYVRLVGDDVPASFAGNQHTDAATPKRRFPFRWRRHGMR